MKPFDLWKLLLCILFMLGMAVVVLVVIDQQLDLRQALATVANAKRGWILAALLCVPVFYCCEARNIGSGLRLAGYRPSIRQLLSYSTAGYFFSGITPASSGGQPGQLYFMHKDGMSLGAGTFALLLDLLSYQCASLFFGLLGAGNLLRLNALLDVPPVMMAFFLLGFVLNAAVLLGIVSLMISQRASKCIAGMLIRLGRLRRKKPDCRWHVLRFVARFRVAAVELRKHKGVLPGMLLVSLLQLTAMHSITYLCYRALGYGAIGPVDMVLLQGLLFISVNGLPLPGASGASEGAFTLMFNGVYPAGSMGSAVILTRCMSFVIPLIGAGLLLMVLRMWLAWTARCERAGTP